MKKRTKAATHLSAGNSGQQTGKIRKDGYVYKIAPKAISQARSDIATWKAAIKQATQVDNPKRIKLQNLYRDIVTDALLSSQIDNRKLQSVSTGWSLRDKDGNINEEITAFVKGNSWFYDLVKAINDSFYFGPTIIELFNDASGLKVVTIPRQNIDPKAGLFFFDENDTKGILYRDTKEFGTWLFEFGNPEDLGLLNKAIPHVLFKRFAQSCWSELCEIYGIPPRVMKTNTQDPAMLSRGEQMMRDMGAAAWFIIDESESFEFATGVQTNGDVYNNLIRLCNNEISLLVSGAVIGQDTKNGNESKEQLSIEMLNRLVISDKAIIESIFNNNLLPGLYLIGLIPDGLTFAYDPQEDIQELWTRTKEVMPYMEVDPEWIKGKFGIEVLKAKTTPTQSALSFFD